MYSETQSAYYLTSDAAEILLSAFEQNREQVRLSLDLNLSESSCVIRNGLILFEDGSCLDIPQLRKIVKKENRVFMLKKGELSIVEISGEHYYKLVPTNGAATLEIDGIRMHRTKEYDPFDDSEEKARTVVKSGDVVLDTCGGLGYTAIWAVRLGARSVISVERNPDVRWIRGMNPWSADLCQDKITLISDDILKYINTLENASFDTVIHDPPRFSMAGELYGEAFYKELYRIIKRGGRLFHYTGNPYQKKQGQNFMKNTVKRLQHSGFKEVRMQPDILGVTANK